MLKAPTSVAARFVMRTCTLPEGGAQDESEPARARTYGGAQSGWTTPIHTGGRLPLYIALHLRAQARVLLMFKRRRAGAVRRHRTPEAHMTRAACKYWQIGGQVTYIYAASCTCCRVRRMLRGGRPTFCGYTGIGETEGAEEWHLVKDAAR